MAYLAISEMEQVLRRSRDRVKRVFRDALGWQILTLEGITAGPYETRDEAEEALRDHFEDTLVPKFTPRREKAN